MTLVKRAELEEEKTSTKKQRKTAVAAEQEKKTEPSKCLIHSCRNCGYQEVIENLAAHSNILTLLSDDQNLADRSIFTFSMR